MTTTLSRPFAFVRSTLHALVPTSSALVLALAAGCGSVEQGDDGDDPGMMMPDPDPGPDTTPPTIATTVPANGGVGVHADDSIVVTFSEPMDTASVEAAYSSDDLPSDAVAFAWDSTNTVLTITPAEPFEYPQGITLDPETVERLTYGLTIGTGATDAAGNALAQPLELSFATKRRLFAVFPINNELTRVIRTSVLSINNPIWLGDNASNETYRSYLTFDLSAMPAGAEIEGAEFYAYQLAPTNTPYVMGSIMTEHVTFATIEEATAAPVLSTVGAFSSDPMLNQKRRLVTEQLQDDVDNRVARGNRTQYRLQFEQATDGDSSTDVAVFDKGSFELVAVFLVD